jgi:hypothetical protein
MALSKQVLLLNARHFYIKPPFPPSSGPAFLSLFTSHTSSPFLTRGIACPAAMPAAVSTERLSNAANRGFDGRISNSTPVFAYALARGLVIPDHRHAFRTLDELLNRCVAHLGPLGHEDRLQHARSGGLKRPPVLTALERNGMVEANPTRSCYTRLTIPALEN